MKINKNTASDKWELYQVVSFINSLPPVQLYVNYDS